MKTHTWRVKGVCGIDAELCKGGREVASAVAPTEGGIARLLWVKWCWQW